MYNGGGAALGKVRGPYPADGRQAVPDEPVRGRLLVEYRPPPGLTSAHVILHERRGQSCLVCILSQAVISTGTYIHFFYFDYFNFKHLELGPDIYLCT